jgi:hypothetical protein
LLALGLIVGTTSTATADIPKKGVLPATVVYKQDPCSDYVARGGPLAGVIISPMVTAGGVGLAVAGSQRKQDGSLTDSGKAMLAGGVVMAVVGFAAAIASGKRLQKRNKRRWEQQRAGCPAY